MTHPPSNDIAASEPQADQLPQAIPDDVLAVANYLGSGNFDEAVEEITREMLLVAQAECPVHRYFGPGVYIREVSMRAGTFAVGHRQKQPHLNILLTGSVAMIDTDGTVKIATAPLIFNGTPGRKVGYVLQDMTWLNVYATTETDADRLDAMFIDKTSEEWVEHYRTSMALAHEARAADREDFARVLTDYGFTEEQVWEQSRNEADQTAMPPGYPVSVCASPIHGRGLFATAPIPAGQIIAPARIGGLRTPAGRYTNHSATPNAKPVAVENGDVLLVSTRDISGCMGGDDGEEITIDYRDSLRMAGCEVTALEAAA